MQSFLQYRRLGAELKIWHSRDEEHFHRQHSGFQHDRSSLHKILTSGHSRHAALGDLFYLAGPWPRGQDDHDEEHHHFADTDKIQVNKNDGAPQAVDGIEVRDRTTKEGEEGTQVFVVNFTHDDPNNPRNWKTSRRIICVVMVAMIAFLTLASSAIDSAVAPEAAKAFKVSLVVESLATGIWLIGFALGSMVVGPFSETFGRNPVYIGSLLFFLIFNMASALSPHIAAQIVFRFFVGVFAAPPLVCGGATISDLFDPLEKTWAFSVYAIPGFGGSMLGPVIGSFIYLCEWRWADWLTLTMGAAVTLTVFLFLPETHPATIQAWKAKQLRNLISDDRYQAQSEIIEVTFWHRLEHALTRPFVLGLEPIVMAISIYLTIIWTVLFIFLDGYPSIFMKTYNLTEGVTNVLFVAMYVGVLCAIPTVYLVYQLTKRDMTKCNSPEGDSSAIRPETRHYFAMIGGGWAVPVSLFWLAWTSFPHISIWCPLVSTSLFGFGLITIFFSSYMYVIDAYEVNAASALAFTTVTPYLVAGGITVAGVPFFDNVGHHWVLTILAIVSLLLGAPVPYLLYFYGPKLRKRSENSINKSD